MTKKKHISDDARYSIVQKDFTQTKYEGTCFICRRRLRKGEGAVHEIFCGSANRQKSKDYGLVVRLCFNHHDRSSPISVHHNPKGTLNQMLHDKGREAFLMNYPNKSFIEVFGRNYAVYSQED